MKKRDRIGLLSSPQNMSRWKQFLSSYSMWVFLAGLTVFGALAYFAGTALPMLMFLIGLPLLGYLKGLRKFWLPAAITGAILLLAFVRSDFVVMLSHGVDLGRAYQESTRYFQAPVAIWFICWAMICAANEMTRVRARVVIAWFAYVLIMLASLQLLEALSNMGIHNSINQAFFHGHRPEMVVVHTSNTNTLLLMLFWPMTLFFINRSKALPVIGMLAAIVSTAVVTDTNAQLLALAASAVVFYAVRFWPRWLAYREITPERVVGVLAAFAVVIFPALILNMLAFGFDIKLKTDLLPSWAARIDIWSFTVERCLEKPLWGWGYEAARLFEPDIPNHPHNMSLQAWLELGVPGLILLAALWAVLYWQMGTKSDFAKSVPVVRTGLTELNAISGEVAVMSLGARIRPYAMATATAFFVVNMVSYGLWRMWFYCAGALAVAVMILVIKTVREDMRLQTLL